jgi:hypothetical protein
MAVSVVRTSTYVDSSASSATTFFSGTPTVGNYVAVTTTEYTTTQCVCTDDATGGSNSYTTHRAVVSGGSNRASVAKAKLDRTKANLGVTVNCGAGLFAAGAIEISGVVDTNPVDLDASQTTDDTSPWTLALSAPAQTDEILIAAFSFGAANLGTHNITIDQWSGATPTAIFINDGPSINSEYGAGAYLITTDLTARTVSFSANNNGVEASPIKAISLKGASSATLDQKVYRYFNDDGGESGSTEMAAQNTDVTVASGGVFRIRFGIQASGDPTGKQFRLEYDNVGGSNWKQVP